MLFMARASREGLQVSKPYGESASYDFIVETGTVCSRIQVKSTVARSYSGFRCCLNGAMHKKYKLESFNFVAVHVIPASAWFIIPWLATPGCIFLNPGKEDSKYHQFEEAWHLFKPPEIILQEQLESSSGGAAYPSESVNSGLGRSVRTRPAGCQSPNVADLGNRFDGPTRSGPRFKVVSQAGPH